MTEIPKLVLKINLNTMVYVYKNNEKAWLEFNPHQLSSSQQKKIFKQLGLDPKRISQQNLQIINSEDCMSIYIENEEDFLINNIHNVIMPIKTIQNYYYF